MSKIEGVREVYEDKNVFILAKEHGIACQSKTQADIEKAYQSSHFVTRLDQPASGLLILAKDNKSAGMMTNWFKKGMIHKKYVALVEGKLNAKSGELSDPLIKVGAKTYVNEASESMGHLSYTVSKELDRYSLLDIEIRTGRFHQIRAQLSSAGYPIKGDLKYGAKRSNKEGGIYLCCTAITFPDSEIGLPIEISVNPSEFYLPLWKFYG